MCRFICNPAAPRPNIEHVAAVALQANTLLAPSICVMATRRRSRGDARLAGRRDVVCSAPCATSEDIIHP